MCTIIIHGTFAYHGEWVRDPDPGGFVDSVAQGMDEGGYQPDLWTIGGRHVSQFEELCVEDELGFWGRKHAPFMQIDGHFRWSGNDDHDSRTDAGKQLAKYLDAIGAIAPGEPINLIAHSHGGNVIKVATQLVGRHVQLGLVVFMATPHFERADGKGYVYRLNLARLPGYYGARPVLNIYSEADLVQDGLSDLLADLGRPPGLPKVKLLGFEGTPVVNAHRIDPDPAVAHAYDNVLMPSDVGGVLAGIAAHGALHSADIGRMVGYWLASWPRLSGDDCLDYVGLA